MKYEDRTEVKEYFKSIKNLKGLTKEDEMKYWKMMKFGTPEEQKIGREALINSCLKYVVSLVTKYKTDDVETMELVQEGNLGLIESLETFDPENGRLTTWSGRFIKHRILELISTETMNNELGYSPGSDSTFYFDLKKMNKQREQFRTEHGRDPSPAEMVKPRSMSDRHFNDLMRYEKGMLTREDVDEIETLTLPVFHRDNLEEYLADGIEQLSDDKRTIIRMTFGFDDEQISIKECSKLMGLTYERCRQIRMAAIADLRDYYKKVLNE